VRGGENVNTAFAGNGALAVEVNVKQKTESGTNEVSTAFGVY
jgi:hypothetical protein